MLKRKGYIKNEIGITLIALTITIIVLLILAGITIAAISGDNEILQNAARAKEETEQAEKHEKKKLGDMEDTINEYVTGTEVEQVTDSKPGELETDETDANTYIINSIEDLVVFASNVREGNNYEGKTVKLGISLDFNSNKSYVDPLRTDYGEYGYDGELKTLLTTGEGFIPIGSVSDETSSFGGIFDGNDKKIYNCYMNKNAINLNYSYKLALFGNKLNGTIKNLGLIDINYTLKNKDIYGTMAGFCISLSETAKIENCYVTGSIIGISEGNGDVNSAGIAVYTDGTIEKTYNSASIHGEISNDNSTAGCYIGGIVVNANGSIKNCYNSGEIIVKPKLGYSDAGGIARIFVSGSIENCYNSGNIDVTISHMQKNYGFGGIVGNISGTNNNLNNVYNTGKIIINGENNSEATCCVGGISGKNSGKINNSYNVGKIEIVGSTENNNIIIGGILGSGENGTITNCSYLAGTAEKGMGAGTDVTTKIDNIEDMPDILQILGSEFKEDTNNINNGYPLLNWQ